MIAAAFHCVGDGTFPEHGDVILAVSEAQSFGQIYVFY